MPRLLGDRASKSPGRVTVTGRSQGAGNTVQRDSHQPPRLWRSSLHCNSSWQPPERKRSPVAHACARASDPRAMLPAMSRVHAVARNSTTELVQAGVTVVANAQSGASWPLSDWVTRTFDRATRPRWYARAFAPPSVPVAKESLNTADLLFRETQFLFPASTTRADGEPLDTNA